MTGMPIGGDVSVIALWLGHESIETTHVYLNADSCDELPECAGQLVGRFLGNRLLSAAK